MPKYRIYYTEESYGNIIFEADTLEHAKELYNQVFDGETFPEELPNYQRREKSSQINYMDLRAISD